MNERQRKVKRGERGQFLILFVALFTGLMVIGAIVVDVGLWFSERRGAQKEADAVALAGVQAYLQDLADTNGAWTQSREWAAKNDIDLTTVDGVLTSDCSAGNSCINAGVAGCRDDSDHMPWVEAKIRHVSTSLFFGELLNKAAPDIGAVARACVGSALSAENLTPFVLQSDVPPDESFFDCFDRSVDPPVPLYGSVCLLRVEPGSGVSGQRGYLSLGDIACGSGDSKDLDDNLTYTAKGTCTIGEEVTTDTGGKVGALKKGLATRLAFEIDPSYAGQTCDAKFGSDANTFDDFGEVFSLPSGAPPIPSPDNVFTENDCALTVTDQDGVERDIIPRLVTIVVTDALEKSSTTTTVTGFAGFYIVGCIDSGDAEATKAAIEANLGDFSAYLNRCEAAAGQDVVAGIFVKNVLPAGDVGDPVEGLPLSIVLVK